MSLQQLIMPIRLTPSSPAPEAPPKKTPAPAKPATPAPKPVSPAQPRPGPVDPPPTQCPVRR